MDENEKAEHVELAEEVDRLSQKVLLYEVRGELEATKADLTTAEDAIEALQERIEALEARPTVTYVLQPQPVQPNIFPNTPRQPPPQPVLPTPNPFPNTPWQPPPTITFSGDSASVVHEANPGSFVSETELEKNFAEDLPDPNIARRVTTEERERMGYPDSAGPRSPADTSDVGQDRVLRQRSETRPDPQCSGPGYAHAPHGNCTGYGTDRT